MVIALDALPYPSYRLFRNHSPSQCDGDGRQYVGRGGGRNTLWLWVPLAALGHAAYPLGVFSCGAVAAIVLGPLPALESAARVPIQLMTAYDPALLRDHYQFLCTLAPLPLIGCLFTKLAAFNLLPLPTLAGEMRFSPCWAFLAETGNG
jgi:hypothetical protein